MIPALNLANNPTEDKSSAIQPSSPIIIPRDAVVGSQAETPASNSNEHEMMKESKDISLASDHTRTSTCRTVNTSAVISSTSSSTNITHYHDDHQHPPPLSARPFYGRQEELAILHELYHQACCHSASEDRPCQAVLIAGVSGTGKTALVREFLKQIPGHGVNNNSNHNEEDVIILLQCKYERMHQAEPFSALEQAFQGYILSEKKRDPHQLRHKILRAVGDEGRALLSGVIPAINTLFVLDDDDAAGEDDATSMESSARKRTTHNVYNNNNNRASQKSNQLQYLFAKLVAALTEPDLVDDVGYDEETGKRIVLVLDDLQWADSASLDLLAYLLTADIPNLFLLGAYRPDLVLDPKINRDEKEAAAAAAPASGAASIDSGSGSGSIAEQQTHLLTKWLDRRKDYIQILRLNNHSQAEIGDFLSYEVGCDSTRLLDTIYQKTHGNFFFTMQVVEELIRQGMLVTHQSPSSMEHEIPAESAESVIYAVSQCTANYRTARDAVSEKIQRLSSPQLLHILVVASYLRSHFHSDTLHALLCFLGPQSELSLQELNERLDRAVLEGLLINSVGSDQYQFGHDGIQEAANALVPAGPQRDQLVYNIGVFLKTTDSEDWMVFVAARHWAVAAKSSSLKVDPIDLAELYLECGSRSMTMAAIEQANLYFQQGFRAMSMIQAPWQNHYELTLHLHRSLTETELLLGNYETGYSFANQVLENAHSLMEKVPIYHAMDYALGLEERHHDALLGELQVLRQLDEVPGTMTGLRDMMQVRQYVQQYTNEEILAFPEIDDQRKIVAIRSLSNAAVSAYCCGKPLLNVSCIIKQTKMAFKYGLCSEVAMAFALYGAILAGHLGDPTTGRRIGKLAREIVKKQQYKAFECETLFLVAGFIDLWCEPFAHVIETFEYAHRAGLAAGNHTYGYGCCYESINASLVAGLPLSEIADSFCDAMIKIRQYKMISIERVLAPLGVPIFYLLGRKVEVAGFVIDGTIPDWGELEKLDEVSEDSSNHLSLTWAYFVRMMVAYYFGEMDVAERMSKKYNDIMTGDSYTFLSLGAFFSGLINMEMYRRTGRRKFKWRAQTYTNKLGKTVKIGGVNNTHKYHLMQAEAMGAFKTHRRENVKEMYDRAIIEAAEMGCIHDEALSNELAGEFFLRRKHTFWCKDYFAKACLLYKEWGAKAKVDLLLATRGTFIDQSKLKPSLSSSTRADLKNIKAQFESEDPEGKQSLQPAVRIGLDDLADDNCSGLTPIGEFSTYNNDISRARNRWESTAAPEGFSPSPPTAPKRAFVDGSIGTPKALPVNSSAAASASPPRVPKRSASIDSQHASCNDGITGSPEAPSGNVNCTGAKSGPPRVPKRSASLDSQNGSRMDGGAGSPPKSSIVDAGARPPTKPKRSVSLGSRSTYI